VQAKASGPDRNSPGLEVSPWRKAALASLRATRKASRPGDDGDGDDDEPVVSWVLVRLGDGGWFGSDDGAGVRTVRGTYSSSSSSSFLLSLLISLVLPSSGVEAAFFFCSSEFVLVVLVPDGSVLADDGVGTFLGGLENHGSLFDLTAAAAAESGVGLALFCSPEVEVVPLLLDGLLAAAEVVAAAGAFTFLDLAPEEKRLALAFLLLLALDRLLLPSLDL